MRAVAWGQDTGQLAAAHRAQCSGDARIGKVNNLILATTLYKRKQITLDIDATVIESNKRRAKFTYKKHRGYTPMIGHIGETGQVVAVEFREGNESANKNNLESSSAVSRHCRMVYRYRMFALMLPVIKPR